MQSPLIALCIPAIHALSRRKPTQTPTRHRSAEPPEGTG